MAGLTPVIRELRDAVLNGLTHLKNKLHKILDNNADNTHTTHTEVHGIDRFEGMGGGGNSASNRQNPHYTHGVRFFGEEQLHFYTMNDAKLGQDGSAVFMMPADDAANVGDTLDAVIESGMAGSVKKAWNNGGSAYGALIPVDHLSQRLPTMADAGDSIHFIPGGNTAVNIGGEYFLNPTREFVVDGGTTLPPGTTIFKLNEDGIGDIIGIYGKQ